MVDITAVIGRAAIDALRRYGRGRHRADLNMGDCFAYVAQSIPSTQTAIECRQ
jgi:uncharacterized protein with PIN domain